MFLVYVQSNTLVGDQSHPVGRVLAEIVKPNIPVKNGVVHLISSPLMIVDNTVTQFLEVGVSFLLLLLLKEVWWFWAES